MSWESKGMAEARVDSPSSLVGLAPVEFSYPVKPALPLEVHVHIGRWWPRRRKTGTRLACFISNGMKGHIWVPWEHASQTIIAHEGVHMALWAGRYARSNRLLPKAMPRALHKSSWERGIAKVEEEFVALTLEAYLHRVAIRLADNGIVLQPYTDALSAYF